MTSFRQIEANRRNARKATTNRSPRIHLPLVTLVYDGNIHDA